MSLKSRALYGVRRLAGGSGGQLSSIYGIVVDFVALLSFRPAVGTAERDGALMQQQT